MILYLFSADSVEMSVKGGKPKKAFNALAIVMARDETAVQREELEFQLGTELASKQIDLGKPKIKDITDLLEQAGEGFHVLAWANKKPKKKKGVERSYMPVIHNPQSQIRNWQMCSRRPPYNVLVEAQTDETFAQMILNRMRRG